MADGNEDASITSASDAPSVRRRELSMSVYGTLRSLGCLPTSLHTDTRTVGNFGSHDRLDYTTIGNGVNLASRLESNSRPNQILISEDTYLLIREQIICDKLDKIQVKNIKHPIQTYEVRGHIDDIQEEQQMDEQADGFSLFIDPGKIDGIGEKRELLERALSILDSLDD